MVGFAGRSNASQKLRLLLSMLVAFVTTSVLQVQGKGTRVGFYSYTCPRAESIVRSTVAAHFQSDPAIAPGLLRMHFHDCFVRGCDASILIDGDDTEKTIFNLRGYEVIDDAKAQLEEACPGIVSCADILALAARDAVVLANGASWAVPTGRRDGMVSLASDVANLPGVTESIDALKQKFADKGLSTLDLVTLLGAHTIGASSCEFFNYRLYNFTAAHGVDPVIDPTFVPQLQAMCPLNDDDTTTSLVPLDTGSSDKFDASFFANLRNGRGILETDQKLWTDATTKPFVQRFLQGSYGPPRSNFSVMFGRSMVKLSNIDVKTGSTNGQIRKVCSAIN